MDLIQETFDLFNKNNTPDLSKTYVYACQHVLRPREKMLPLLVKFGIPKNNIFILGKAYSTNNKLLRELRKAGFNVNQPPFDSKRTFDEQHHQHCVQLFEDFQKNVSSGSRVIVLDDGAALLSVFNQNFAKIDKKIEVMGIEQTSSGFRKLENKKLRFPIINVARSPVKLDEESPAIAATCLEKMSVYFPQKNITDKRYFVVGLGPIGQAFVKELQSRGEDVVGYDINSGDNNLTEKIESTKSNIVIGATGSASVSRSDIEYINSLGYPIYLVSASSSDREFPASFYRKNQAQNTHTEIKYGNVIFVNGGFPINFEINQREEGIEWIEQTICLILGSILYLAQIGNLYDLKKEFINVPQKITGIL